MAEIPYAVERDRSYYRRREIIEASALLRCVLDRNDHLDFVPKPGRYPLIVSPIIKDVKLNRVLVDGGSPLNILFLKTFDQGLGVSYQHSGWLPDGGVNLWDLAARSARRYLPFSP